MRGADPWETQESLGGFVFTMVAGFFAGPAAPWKQGWLGTVPAGLATQPEHPDKPPFHRVARSSSRQAWASEEQFGALPLFHCNL